MSYRPQESTLIAYLHGELSETERQQVEQFLSENEEAREELGSLADTLNILGALKDKEVEAPAFVFDNASRLIVSERATTLGIWKRTLAMAASVSLLILVGYFTKANIQFGTAGFQLTFGKVEQPIEKTFTLQEVKGMIEVALDQNNQLIDQRFDNSAAEFQRLVANQQQPDETQLDQYVETLRQQNIEILTGLLEQSAVDQREQTEALLREFALFLDVQRQNDLEAIQTRINGLEDDTQLHQLQTNRILTNMITGLDQPSNQY